MDYRNSKDQDSITISSDVTHVFKVDDNTVYQKEGESGTETQTITIITIRRALRKLQGSFLTLIEIVRTNIV